MSTIQSLIHICIILAIMGSGLSSVAHGAAPLAHDAAVAAETAATADFPITLVSDEFDGWTVGNGFIYWAKFCTTQADGATNTNPYYLKRKPIADGAEAIPQIGNSTECDRYRGMVSDENNIYYYSRATGQIEKMPVTSPNGPSIPLLPDVIEPIAGKLHLDSERIYWATAEGQIFTIPKSGGSPMHLITGNGHIDDIKIGPNRIYWLDDGGLWLADKNCAAPPCAPEQLLAISGGRSFIFSSNATMNGLPYGIYLWQAEAQDVRLLYLPPADPGTGQTDVLYETTRFDFPSGLTAASINSTANTHLYWSENPDGVTGSESRIRRMAMDSGEIEEIAISVNDYLQVSPFADDEYIYFSTLPRTLDPGRRIQRLALDASAIERDIAFDGWEVTQSIQNLENGVPLVADKSTFVRVYGKLTGDRSANTVAARLTGERDGAPLPGSPLWPINGTHALQTTGNRNRNQLDNSWVFELPASWISAGTTDLTVTIDPFDSYLDTNRANNSASGTFTFDGQNNVCIHTWPVYTAAGIPSAQDPNVPETFDHFAQLWPIADSVQRHHSEPITETEFCVPWGLCMGPYELDQVRDGWNWITDSEWVMLKLAQHQLNVTIAWAPNCGYSVSRHSLGIVHPDSNTNVNGVGGDVVNATWVRFPDHEETIADSNIPWSWPSEGETLAHEMAHNLGRKHINCAAAPTDDDLDPNFPYDVGGAQCNLDDRDSFAADTHFGFDGATLTPIAPTAAGDFMSVNVIQPNPRWVSDYTFKAIHNDISSTAAGNQAAQSAAFIGPNVAESSADKSVFVSGLVSPNAGRGHLEYTYTQPEVKINLAALHDMQQANAAHSSAQTTRYHIRFVDPRGTQLADHDIVLNATNHSDELAAYPFTTLLPVPVGTVAKVELMADDKILASREPGLGQPTVRIEAPTASTIVDDALELRWQATDPDADDFLLYNVDYSPDGGQNWTPLITGYPGEPKANPVTYTLRNPEALPGSNNKNSLIRVAASDGYNTAVAVSAPFIVAQRAPQAHILNPQAVQWVEAGEAAPLRGMGYDAEEGTLTGDALNWTVGNAPMGRGKYQLAAGFAPGSHPVTLRVADPTGQAAKDQATLNVAALALPAYNFSLAVDGICDDRTYEGGKKIELAPYNDGSQATVQFVRVRNHLAVCFSNMIRTQDGPPTQAAIYFDADHSRDAVAQPDDIGFLIGEDGTPSLVVGDGSGGFMPYAESEELFLQTGVSATEQRWNAELRFAVDTMNPVVGLLVSHLNVDSSGEDVRWPYRSGAAQPETWAITARADLPRITQAMPLSATVGAPAVTVAISGTSFAPSSIVTWNGQALATTFVDETQLTAVVDAPKLTVAGNHEIRVITPGMEEAPVPGRHFRVSYPATPLTGLLPNSVNAGAAAFDMTISGEGFVKGATVLLNGEAQPTKYVSATKLRVTIPESALVYERDISIRVRNPEPNYGWSNTKTLRIQSPSGAFLPATDHILYLPLITK